MKTVQYKWENEDGQSITLPIDICETIEDILNLDANIDEQRSKRALAARPINNVSEWADQLATNDPNVLQPDEVVFLDDEHTWYHVKGSGLCLANGCSAEYWLPYMFTDENRWETFYLDRDHSKLFHSGMPDCRHWLVTPMPNATIAVMKQLVASTPATVAMMR